MPAKVVSEMHGDAEHIPLAAVSEAAEVLFDALAAALAPQ